jgi:hypothetical protein
MAFQQMGLFRTQGIETSLAGGAAVNLLSLLPDIPLRTLDAQHLAIATEIQADYLATRPTG